MGEDLNLKFQAKKKELEIAFAQLEKFGINTEQYRIDLNEVEKAWEEEQAKSYGPLESAFPGSSLAQASNMASSSKYIKKLLPIYQNLILLFNDYIQIFYSCEALEKMLVIDKIFENNEIDNMAKEIIIDLKKFSQSSNIDWNTEKALADKLMDLSYKIMKLEMLTKKDSLVFTCISQELDTMIPFMSDKICLEMATLYGDSSIQLYSDRAQSKGLENGYFDKDLIREISKYVYSPEQINESEERLQQVKQNRNTIQERQESIVNRNRELKALKKRFTKNLVISATLLAGLFVGKGRILNRIYGPLLYKTEKTTYTEKDGLVRHPINYEPEHPKVVANVYHPWEQGTVFNRLIETYDLSDFTYDALSSYSQVDLSSLSKEQTVQKKFLLSDTEIDKPLYTEYAFYEQDKNDTKYGKADAPLLVDIGSILLTILGLLIEIGLFFNMVDIFKQFTSITPVSKEELLQAKRDAEILKKMQSEYETLKEVIENCKSKEKIKEKSK